ETAAPVDDAQIRRLLTGVQLHDEPAPLAVHDCRRLDAHRVEVVLVQGKYHQVKRMLAAAGNRCTALHRTAIGALTLEALGLEEGQWRYLEAPELALLQYPPDGESI